MFIRRSLCGFKFGRMWFLMWILNIDLYKSTRGLHKPLKKHQIHMLKKREIHVNICGVPNLKHVFTFNPHGKHMCITCGLYAATCDHMWFTFNKI